MSQMTSVRETLIKAFIQTQGGGMKQMNGNKYMEVTCRYYSKWLGQDDILLRDWKGIEYLYFGKRLFVEAFLIFQKQNLNLP